MPQHFFTWPRRVRLQFLWLVACMVGTAILRGNETLDTLTADYQAHGLPGPPEDAQLSILKWSTGTSNGVPQYARVLAFAVQPEGEGQPGFYWQGCRQHSLTDRVVVTATEPTPASLLQTRSRKYEHDRSGFEIDADLPLAVQCSARGWNDLAVGLLRRSRRGPVDRFERRPTRPLDHRAALANVAWNYWCDEFCTEQGDRQRILEHLVQLRQGPHGLDSVAHDNVIADMKATLAEPQSTPDKVERLIDALVDVGSEGNWMGRIYATSNMAEHYSSYRQLQQMGLEAVPGLLKHTHDFRMTRCVDTDLRGTWHVRIADLVRQLLNGLYPDEFAFDFLIREGRGKCVDRRHVLHWWSEAQQVEAKTYLIANALTEESDGDLTANAAVLQALGSRYPEDLVELFATNVDRIAYPSELFEAVGGSSVPDDVKARLFLGSASSDNSWARDAALRQLLKMKHPEGVPLLVRELGKIPKTPARPYWLSSAGRSAQLVCGTDDPRAWAALLASAKRVDIGQRLEMTQPLAVDRGVKTRK